MRSILAAGLLLCAASSSFAAVYDVQADFSNTANPNDSWGYLAGSSFLPHNNSPAPNALNSVMTNGFWGSSSDYNSSVMQATGNGSDTGSYTDADFLVGDVLIHSTNPGTGDPTRVVWTAPADGEIDFDFSTWYAHGVVVRSNTYSLQINDVEVFGGILTPLDDRPNAHDFSDTNISVNAGDTLEIEMNPTLGQNLGSLAGISLMIDFTGIPEPTTLSLLAASAMTCLRRHRA